MRTHFYYITQHAPEPNPFVTFLNYDPLSQLMQGAGVAVLTLLISFAIGIFIHHLGDGERKNNFLDLHIALDYVWRFKQSVVLLLVVVITPFFMGVDSTTIQVIAFALWAIALAGLIFILLRLYAWVKGDKDDFRREYLSNFPKSPTDKIVTWSDFWSTDWNAQRRFTEPEFFVPFSREIDTLFRSEKKEDWQTLQKLLDGFVSKIENRNKVFLLVFPEFFPKVLEWHYLLWKKQYSEFAKDRQQTNVRIESHVFEVDQLVDSVIKFVTKEALVGKSGNAFSYFKTLETHVDKYQSELIVGDKHTYLYVEQLPIYEDCFSLVPKSQESYNIWEHYFPESWKITISNLEKNKISAVWYHRFLNWSQSRISGEKKEWDKDLEQISRELFPSVDPITWAKIYTFVIRPWSDSRVKSVIETGVNFGYAGRVISGWGDDFESNISKIYESELEATFDLAMYLFGNRIFTNNNLTNWLSELEQLDYPEDSDEYKRKQVWTGIFRALKKRAENKDLKHDEAT